ncbi:hypothetical protein EDB84DRAFT_896984 [Lactarius hengduanensis]|nr:hypothetical protein EDB84DRAFT_896984 [Lactarius hengduanensis]
MNTAPWFLLACCAILGPKLYIVILLNGTCQWHATRRSAHGLRATLCGDMAPILMASLASALLLNCDWVWSPCAVQAGISGAHKRPKTSYEATKSDERMYGTLGPHCAASVPVAGPPPSVYFARWFRVLRIEGESRPYELRVLATESEVMEVWV